MNLIKKIIVMILRVQILIKKCNDQKDKIQKEEENFFDFDDTIFCAKKEKDKKKKHPRKRKIY